MKRIIGKVVDYDLSKGIGHIEYDSGNNRIEVYYNELSTGLINLFTDDVVEFELKDTSKGCCASRVRKIGDRRDDGDIVTICQFSDIHFGDHNAYSLESFGDNIYKGPTQDLERFLKYDLNLIPDFYACCGDIASNKLNDLDFFKGFVETLPVKSGTIYEKLLVVPGNHDNFWISDATDKLKSFKEKIVDSLFRTPFGLDDKNCICMTVSDCPMSAYIYEKEMVIFLLVTSSLYTGEVEKNLRTRLMSAGIDLGSRTEDALLNRIRNEHGYLPGRYYKLVEPIIDSCIKIVGSKKYDDYLKIALVHHQFESFFDDELLTINGDPFRNILHRRKFSAILHGHVHKVSNISVKKGFVSAVPCPSISGRCSETSNGINILTFSRKKGLLSAVVYLTENGVFLPVPYADLANLDP